MSRVETQDAYGLGCFGCYKIDYNQEPSRDFWGGTHIALAKETPAGLDAEKNPGVGAGVVSMPRLGGLHHRYDLAA